MPSLAPATSEAAGGAAGRKRKLDEKNAQKYYAVRAGARPGIYLTWHECQAQITGFKGAKYKSFFTREDAAAFVAGQDPGGGAKDKGEPRFYGVAVGNPPGIYDTWAAASKAIVGVKGPKYKKFPSRAEAANFVRMYASAATRQALSTGASTGTGTANTAGRAGVAKKTRTAAPAVASVQAPAPQDEDDEEDDEDDEEEEDDDEDEEEDDEEDEEDAAQILQPAAKRAKSNAGASTAAASATSTVLQIYTDGSSLGNGQRGASAGIGVYFGPGDKRNISERLRGEVQTNQRAELSAILRALQVVSVAQPVRIVSDSKYAIQCVTEWYTSWERSGWKTSKGDPVMNQDLIKAVRSSIDARDRAGTVTMFRWVKGHSQDSGNAAADMLAVQGARLRT